MHIFNFNINNKGYVTLGTWKKMGRYLQMLRFCQRNAKPNQETDLGKSYRLPRAYT